MDLTRREFLAGMAATCAFCGCSSVPPLPPPKYALGEDGTVEIPPECRAAGGQARVGLGGGEQALVWRDDAGLHAAGAACTHRGGEIVYDAEQRDLHCPTHGARFRTDGTCKDAELALRPLTIYDVEVAGDRMRISR